MGIWSALSNGSKILTDERFRYYYWHRTERDPARRRAWADRIAGRLPPAAAGGGSERLAEDGILPLASLVSARDVADMRGYFEARESSDPYRPKLGRFVAPAAAPPETHVAYYDNEQVIAAPHALRIANDPRVIGPVGDYLGAKPTISYMAAWWSMPRRGAAEHAELYHRDVDDLRFVKLFVYLTDVDEGSGPHNFVRGSPSQAKLTEIRRYSNDEVSGAFDAGDLLRLTGPAGTAFLENTYGLHRGEPPAERPRLLFQVLYSLKPYIAGPKRPIATVEPAIEGVAIDPYVNRVYCRVG